LAAFSRRAVVRAQAVVLAAVLLAGLGRVLTYLPPPPEPTALELWQRLVTARSARVELTVEVTAGRGAFRESASGVLDTAAERSRLTVRSTALATGEVVYDEVATVAVAYVRTPGGTQWFSFGAVDTPFRPAGLVRLLAAAGALRRLGPARVRDVPTTRYAAQSHSGRLEVHVDRDRMPRRITFQQGSIASSVDLYDFLAGEPVVVPTGAVDVSGLAEALRRSTR
jgi:hypothetical protein